MRTRAEQAGGDANESVADIAAEMYAQGERHRETLYMRAVGDDAPPEAAESISIRSLEVSPQTLATLATRLQVAIDRERRIRMEALAILARELKSAEDRSRVIETRDWLKEMGAD